jgi:ribosomal protein S18 acetylase RimI-like enzyme
VNNQSYELIEAENPRQFAAGAALFNEYASQLGVDLCFQGFAAELAQLPLMYGPPSGCLLLIMRGGTAVGCGGVRRLADGVCEMKRLYIQGSARGAQLGRRLVTQLLRRAQSLGYHTMRLDTLTEMTAARSLYRSLGFREIAAYYDNPLANPVYMELTITGLDLDAAG